MGIDLDRFVSKIVDELQCSICCLVLENPVQINECQHAFCEDCINDWFKVQRTCPIDRKKISRENIIPGSRLLNVLLNRLEIKCDFSSSGCNSVVVLEFLSSHVAQCKFNPTNLNKLGGKEAGQRLSKDERVEYDEMIEEMIQNMDQLNSTVKEKDRIISEFRRNERSSNRIISRLNEEVIKLKRKLEKYEGSFGGKGEKCGRIWSANTIAYRCETCQLHETMALCAECFKNGDHSGHAFKTFSYSGGEGYCDCGDETLMKKGGFCKNHGKEYMK